MAIVINTPVAAGQVGWGYSVDASGFTGPTALDDKFIATVELPSGLVVAWGSTLFQGNTAVGVQIGAIGVAFPISQRFLAQLVTGAAVTIRCARYTHANTFIEQVVSGGFVWDPLQGLGSLVSIVLSSSSTAGLASILAAVSRTYTTP